MSSGTQVTIHTTNGGRVTGSLVWDFDPADVGFGSATVRLVPVGRTDVVVLTGDRITKVVAA
jgi:hypothetical protein